MTNEARAYYNEHDPYAAAWLENLIAAGEIAPGDVDTRSILDVRPADLDGYTQCHFFAGIGIWSRALREAGWPDDRRVWTGSCPCQPLSAAGAGLGFDDERHLFPGWQWLIEQHRPEAVFGEQVASSLGLDWADLVQADLEAAGYAVGFVDTCAAGFRSFHIRQRLYFAAELEGSAAVPGYAETIREFDRMGNADGPRGAAGIPKTLGQRKGVAEVSDDRGGGLSGRRAGKPKSKRLADAPNNGQQRTTGWSEHDRRTGPAPSCNTAAIGLADADGGNTGPKRQQRSGQFGQLAQDSRNGDGGVRADPADGYWRNADWLFCRDGKWRPAQSGTFPLAHENTARMGRLRAYGNGLDLAQATAFVRAYLERDMDQGHPHDLFEWRMT